MRIQVKQSGGYAGMDLDLVEVDTATLDAATAQQLERMVRDSGYFAMPARLPEAPDVVGADQLEYEVTVEDSGRRHTVRVPDSVPEAQGLRNLISVALRAG